MKPLDVKSDSYLQYNLVSKEKDPKLKIGDYLRKPKYKNIFAKGYTPNWSEEDFVISKVKNTAPWTYVTSDLKGEDIIGTSYENELQKSN